MPLTMPAPTPTAHLYLANQRGRHASEPQQRFGTRNFGAYWAEGREPVGQLLAFNEELLAGGRAVTLAVAQAAHLLLRLG